MGGSSLVKEEEERESESICIFIGDNEDNNSKVTTTRKLNTFSFFLLKWKKEFSCDAEGVGVARITRACLLPSLM